MGTAVGSPMAPAYASLFMGKLEQDFIQSRSIGPSAWLRFLDDIFMVWDHSLECLHEGLDEGVGVGGVGSSKSVVNKILDN